MTALHSVSRRAFLAMLSACGLTSGASPLSAFADESLHFQQGNGPARIVNAYVEYLPGERESLAAVPRIKDLMADAVVAISGKKTVTLHLGESLDGWQLVAITEVDGKAVGVMEKRVTHRGAIAFVSMDEIVAVIPKWIGDLAQIRPRPVAAPEAVQLKRAARHVPGPDVPGNYILGSTEDPSYENVAALGPEYIGWTLVSNEQSNPQHSVYLQADGTSRERLNQPPQTAWAPDELNPVVDPQEFLPTYNPQCWQYVDGHSKRTLLGGYLPVADLGVWNPQFACGYELMCLLPDGANAVPLTRLRIMIPEEQVKAEMHIWRDEHGRAFVEKYPDEDAPKFFAELLIIWRHWENFFSESMPVQIPDEWLLAGARAGIVLSRCSYRGLEPTYQVGEGAYTQIPERSHALFPVAQYEFIWAHQLWNLTGSSDKYFQFYLDKYVMQNGDFLYNKQDQVEAPFCVGMILWNSARGYFFERNLETFRARLPTLRSMVGNLRKRYDYSKSKFPPGDPHHGLIWGSPEADWGDPKRNLPEDHPYFYGNAAGVWRGLKEHAAALLLASQSDAALRAEAAEVAQFAVNLRRDVTQSLQITEKARRPEMRAADLAPFTPEDTGHNPKSLASYENHRFMEDWFLADWGDPRLDLGHLRHRELAGMQLVGLETNDDEMRTSNFMAHGTLSVRIRQEEYRPYLLTLYGLGCFAQDSGNRYAPEDAMLPGGFPGEGSKYWWSSVINSTLQLSMGLRWLLCYEESDAPRIHLQKAAPKHWFEAGQVIDVQRCPTRFGRISWRTEAKPGGQLEVMIECDQSSEAEVHVHLRRPDGQALTYASAGEVRGKSVVLPAGSFAVSRKLTFTAN